MALFGTRVRRTEDARLLIGGGCYVGDVPLTAAAHVTYVTSMAAHARLLGVDVERARRMPGVLAVVSAADLDVGPMPPVDRELPVGMVRPLLATGAVHFVGEPIVAIVSETAAEGADAADEVVVDVEPLPPVVDLDAALRGEVLVFPEAGTNVVRHAEGGTADSGIEGCPVVVRATFRSARLAPCPIETRAAACEWGADGRLTHWSSCQGAHPIRTLLCTIYGLEPDRVRVIAPDVGGSFGAKARPSPEEVLLPWLSARVGRPLRWAPPRSQDMVGLGHSRAQIQHVELGGRRDGTIDALRVRLLADSGAYAVSGHLMPRNTGALSPGAYHIPRVHWEMDAVATTTTPIASYRGAGRPEAAALIERMVDLFAAEIGTDPVEVRRVNLIRADEFPYTSATGLQYDTGDYAHVLDLALAAAGYDEVRAEQNKARAAGDPVQIGVGVATFVDRTAALADTSYGAAELRPDGTVLVRTGSSPYGQGHETAWAMLVADRTGLPLEAIEVIHGDTDQVARGGITGGSKSAQRAGSAVAAATDDLVAQARQVVANALEAAVDDVVLELSGGGIFHVAGTPTRALGWTDVAEAAADPLRCEVDMATDATYPFGAYVAVVEVDIETGRVRLRRLITVDDAGRILNPLLAEGQVHGGAAQGAAQALLEEFVYDDDGNPLTTNFADYPVISAAELPSFESSLFETTTPNNPLGAKGIAESGTIGAPPAVQNAVIDAVRHLGVDHIDLPCTPQRVWDALRRAR
jgi:carbon-monoxide dehydrogenase large subunit